MSVADLSIKDTDEDEKQALATLAEKEEKRRQGHQKDSEGGALYTPCQLLDQFLRSSKEIYHKTSDKPSTSKGITSVPVPRKLLEVTTASSSKAEVFSDVNPTTSSVHPIIDSEEIKVRGFQLRSDAGFTDMDLRDARSIDLGRAVMTSYNPGYSYHGESCSEKLDAESRFKSMKRDESSGIRTIVKTEIIYKRSSDASDDKTNQFIDSESCQEDDDYQRGISGHPTATSSSQILEEDSYFAAAGGLHGSTHPIVSTKPEATSVVGSANVKCRKRRRKNREIRKRFVKQILVRGENVVLVARPDKSAGAAETSQ